MAVKIVPILGSTIDVTGTLSDSTGDLTIGDNLEVSGTISVGTTVFDPNSTLELKGNMADGASAVAVEIDSGVALSTSGAKIVSIRNNNTEKSYITKDGTYYANVASGTALVAGPGSSGLYYNTTYPNYIGATTYIDGVTLYVNGSVRNAASPGATGITLGVWPTDGATAKGLYVNTLATLANASSKILSLANNGSEKAYLDYAGQWVTTGAVTVGGALVQNNTDAPLELKGWSTDSATASGVRFYTGNALSTAGATIAEFFNFTSEKINFQHNGTIAFPDKTISTASGDAVTINAPNGRFRKDNSGATFTLTNNCVTANSIVICQICSATPGVTIDSVVPTANTVTVTFSAAPAGDVDVNFVVFN